MAKKELKLRVEQKETLLNEFDKALVAIAISEEQEREYENIMFHLKILEQSIHDKKIRKVITSMMYFVAHDQSYRKREVCRAIMVIKKDYDDEITYLKEVLAEI